MIERLSMPVTFLKHILLTPSIRLSHFSCPLVSDDTQSLATDD